MGVMSVIMVATMTYLSHSHMESQVANERLARNDLERQLTGILSDPVVCTKFLASFKLPSSAKKATSSAPVTVSNIKRIPASAETSGPDLVSVGGSASALNPRMGVKTIEFVATGPTTGTIKLAFDQSTITRAMRTLVFPITFQTDSSGTTITGCTSLSAQALCLQMGGTFDPAAKPACNLTTVVCSNTQFLTTDSTGKSICRDLTNVLGPICPAGKLYASNGSSITCVSPPAPAPAPAPTPAPVPAPSPSPNPVSCPNWVNTSVVCPSSQSGAYQTIAQYYVTYHSHCADSVGFNFWTQKYNSGAMTLIQIRDAIAGVTTGPHDCSVTCDPARTQYPLCNFACSPSSATCTGTPK